MNDNLSPAQFFHGTSRSAARDIEKTGLSEGAHLTTNPDAARQYARYASGGTAWTKAKGKQGVVLAVTVNDGETREGSYANDHFVSGHSVTTAHIGPDRVTRT